MIPGTDQPVQDPAGSSTVAVPAVVVAAGCAACGGLGAGASVGAGLDVTNEPGTEQRAGKEAAWSEKTAETVPAQTAGENLVVVAVAADEPAPGATAWTAGADGLAGTAVDITVLGS